MINKKLLRNIILSVVVLAVLAGSYYFVDKMPDKTQPQETPPPTPSSYVTVFEINQSDITEVNIINIKNQYTVAKNADDISYIKEYPNIEFMSASLNGIFYDFARISASREVVDETLDFGFETSGVEATVFVNDGSSKNFKLGNQVIGDSGYFLKADGKVYVIPEYTANSFLKGIDDFRNRNLAAIDGQSVSDFNVTKNGSEFLSIRLITEEEREAFSQLAAHAMTYPNYTGVASDKFGELLQNITDIYVVDFISDNPSDASKYGIGKMSVEIKDAENITKVLYGNKDDKGNIYAMLEGKNFIFTQNPAIYDTLDKLNPLSIMEKFIHLINIEKINSVTIEGAGQAYKLVISGTEDNYEYSMNGKTVYEKDFKAAYQEVIGITANGFVEHEVTDTEYTVTFDYKDGTQETYEYKNYDERNYAASINGKIEYTILKKKLSTAMENITTSYNN